jgi:hypothetical protein
LEEASALLAHPQRSDPALTIKRVRQGDSSVFQLDQSSENRLRILHGEAWVSPRITLSDDVEAAFQAQHGDIRDHLTSMMTGGLDPEHLLRLGGIEIVDE